jgi:hypothetical protein
MKKSKRIRTLILRAKLLNKVVMTKMQKLRKYLQLMKINRKLSQYYGKAKKYIHKT